jgi:tellurite resistance protein
MTSVNNKLRILESLDVLSQSQSEQVLDYINNLISPREEAQHKRNKREALKEIRQALNRDRRLGLSL